MQSNYVFIQVTSQGWGNVNSFSKQTGSKWSTDASKNDTVYKSTQYMSSQEVNISIQSTMLIKYIKPSHWSLCPLIDHQALSLVIMSSHCQWAIGLMSYVLINSVVTPKAVSAACLSLELDKISYQVYFMWQNKSSSVVVNLCLDYY